MQCIQISSQTCEDHYPEIFSHVRSLCSGGGDASSVDQNRTTHKVLSFGCATGDEVRSLSRMGYATVHGVEINPALLEVARKRDPRPDVYYKNISDIPANESYDVIFAMAVLCRFPSKNPLLEFPFADFDDVIRMLDERLAVGGLLVIVNAQYDLRETTVGYRYTVEDCPGAKVWNSWAPGDFVEGSGQIKKFTAAGELLPKPSEMPLLFRKCASSAIPVLCRQPIENACLSFIVLSTARSKCPVEGAEALTFGHGGATELTALKALRWKRLDGVETNLRLRERSDEDNNNLRVSELNELPSNRLYDAVFALTVLCVPPNESSPLSFMLFEQAVYSLCSRVKPGGVLVLTNTQYDFRDTECSRDFTGVHLPPGERSAVVIPKLTPAGKPMPDSLSQDTPTIFQRTF